MQGIQLFSRDSTLATGLTVHVVSCLTAPPWTAWRPPNDTTERRPLDRYVVYLRRSNMASADFRPTALRLGATFGLAAAALWAAITISGFALGGEARMVAVNPAVASQ